MRRMRKAMAAAVVVLAAVSASAQETDAETRFHRAYEREVVDGKVADAAREYLAMMDDEKFPERLRLEAKFRFAVTAMLLGRADEARVHLGALASDAKAPETLRARATEYLDAAKGVGVGNEIDRKMQTLVFDLARDSGETSVPAAYREFQVIGKRAVPFLRQLLQHEDAALRVHAFRLLLRMREPNLMKIWSPGLTPDSRSRNDVYAYLVDRPEDRAALERNLRALEDESLRKTLAAQSFLSPQFSVDALRAFGARKVLPKPLSWCVHKRTAETDELLAEWIRSDDSELSGQASFSYLEFASSIAKGQPVRTDLLPTIVSRLETMRLGWRLTDWVPGGALHGADTSPARGLARIAADVPIDDLVEMLAQLVQRAAAAEAGPSNPMESGLVEALAISAEWRDPAAELPSRYGDVVKTWFTEVSKRSAYVANSFQRRVSAAGYRMPAEAATAFAVWAVTTPLPGLVPETRAESVPTMRPRDVPVAMAAIRAADPKTREALISKLGSSNRPDSAEYAREYLRVLPEIVRLWIATGSSQSWPPIGGFVDCARLLPRDEARERFVEVAEAVAEIPDVNRRNTSLTNWVLGLQPKDLEGRSAFWTDVALPAFDRVWPKLAATDRQSLVSQVLSLLDKGPRDAALRTAIGSFVASRYGDVPPHATQHLANAPDVFPLTEWVPKVSAMDNQAAVPNERADPAVREMTADVASVNATVLQFTARSASPDVQREVFDRMLRTGPIERMDVVSLNARLASPDAIEEGIRRMVAEKAPDTNALGRLVIRLRTVRPSEALFPAVRVLLASDEVTAGIDTAKYLGREDLLPDLAGLLDSMDSNVRTAAKEAIDSIVALRKLKEEARRGAGGK